MTKVNYKDGKVIEKRLQAKPAIKQTNTIDIQQRASPDNTYTYPGLPT